MDAAFSIEFRNAGFSAGKRRILDNCSFSVAHGGFTGLIGPNGAGKSTLLGLCNGLAVPQSGSVRSLGLAVNAKTAPALRKRIGYVAQWRAIDPRQPITVFESVLSGSFGRLGFFRSPGRPEKDLARQSLELVEAAHLSGRPLGHLSGGEAQRVAIARALCQTPELLLLDEPTASLDWQAGKDILTLISGLRDRLKLTIIMATHELNALHELCDALIFLKHGRIIWQGSVEEGLQSERLSELFSSKVNVFHHGGKPVVLM